MTIANGLFIRCRFLLADEVRTGTYRQLFHPEQLITGKEDAGTYHSQVTCRSVHVS